ncbi:uncharacterized protein LOC110692047 [Chenopodium quinoa]|uniref:uncharacterized protein LOC110692047 n=1 Tax=Chenopodium quinoa TaxID=63459 RepID=UPI000B77EC77|nr:uncharacterized protein LOC110692047 [Chenopodium quinoa]
MEMKGKNVVMVAMMLMLIIVVTSANTINDNGNDNNDELITLPSQNILMLLDRVISPKINHNLGCVDSAISKGQLCGCSKIVDILNIYEATSVQKINYEKSEVSFRKGVNVSKQGELVDLLQMRPVVKHEKYLGLPTIVGRSKRMVLAALKDRIWKKLQGYKGRLLSRSEKEVLIKSVIQAIPTYLMGVYKLPNSVIEEIRGLTARFWWGNSDSRRRVHWLNWEVMCKPKCLGGMGFRDMGVFNKALLGCECSELAVTEPAFDFKEMLLDWKQKNERKCLVKVAFYGRYRAVGMRNKSKCNSPKKWLPPPSDFVKIDCDACLKTDGWIGLGAAPRNAAGEVLFEGG